MSEPLTWFGGHVGVMELTNWTLHLLPVGVTSTPLFAGATITTTLCGVKTRAPLVTARKANSPKCQWCETCLGIAQAPTANKEPEHG